MSVGEIYDVTIGYLKISQSFWRVSFSGPGFHAKSDTKTCRAMHLRFLLKLETMLNNAFKSDTSLSHP